MTVDLPTSDGITAAEVLEQAAQFCRERKGDRPTSAMVLAALLQAEQTTRRQRQSLPFPAGEWQLGFATGVKKLRAGGITPGHGFYLPKLVTAGIGFEAADPDSGTGTVQNFIRVGGVSLKLSGVCRYQARKNLLAFDFTAMHLKLLGVPLYQGAIRGGETRAAAFAETAIAQLPFFAFFAVTDTYIAARGRGGGLALWYHA